MRDNTKFFLITVAAGVAMASAARADDDRERGVLGVELHAGQTSLSGSLSSKSTAPTYGLDLLVRTPRDHYGGEAVGGFAALWSLDFSETEITVKTNSPFPFTPGKKASLSEDSIVPTLCVMANLPVQSCLGFGWTQIDVEGNSNAQSYGTYRIDLRIGQFLREGLTGGFLGHYYNVQQTVNGTDSSFAGLAYEAAIGWQW